MKMMELTSIYHITNARKASKQPKKKRRAVPVNWIFWEEFRDFGSKIAKLVDTIGAKIPTRSSGGLKQQDLSPRYIFNMYSSQPMVFLGVF